ncbi:sensor histidine kinase [Gordonia insulae]|uniref:Histidine kinase/HSP90-like ATPase domain-containing protein n=1 Tax=Gordonia insulae TaxID=2420509 RepID=A0A3G8JT88_9ACTN|nr:ATP-binding protein [Gordonia insulae]AZG48341.1 hypothetical protein D7316_04958 [Gordonia insulae]
MVVIDRRPQVGHAAVDRVRAYLGGFRGPRVDDSDVTRMQRIGARFVGCGLLVFTLVMLPVTVRCADLTDAWWTPVSLLLVVGPALALVTATLRPVPQGLMVLTCVSAIAYVVATLLWFVAWRGVPDDVTRYSVWLCQFPSVPSIALVLVLRPGWAFVHLVGATVLAHAANQVGLYGEIRPATMLSAPLTMALSGVFMAVAYATVRNVQSLDARRAAMLRAAASSAADMAQEGERTRFAAMIHDKVIASLLAVGAGRSDPRVARQAAATLEELDRRDDDTEGGEVTVVRFADGIRRSATAVGGRIRTEIAMPEEEISYPTSVVAAMTGTTDEAVRNWRRHAGPGAHCVIDADFHDGAVRIVIADDGVGFDPRSVSPERYGIAVGVHGRMDALPGGSARIHSAPGEGTAVVVEWRQP